MVEQGFKTEYIIFFRRFVGRDFILSDVPADDDFSVSITQSLHHLLYSFVVKTHSVDQGFVGR